MPFDKALADRVRALLLGPHSLKEKRMFGGLAFMVTRRCPRAGFADSLISHKWRIWPIPRSPNRQNTVHQCKFPCYKRQNWDQVTPPANRKLYRSQNSLSRLRAYPATCILPTPVLAKHTKSFNPVDTLSVGVDRIERNFEPMQRQVESWRQTQITDAHAKLIFYSALWMGKLDAPKIQLPDVHRLYFEPQYAEFSPRTMFSLSNAFTSAFKTLDPVPQFKATAKPREFLSQLAA